MAELTLIGGVPRKVQLVVIMNELEYKWKRMTC